MKIVIAVNCPDCDNEIHKNIVVLSGDQYPVVHIFNFEQEEWYCDKCDVKFYSGDFDLMEEE